jgi:ferrous iron transport protein A
MTLLDWPDRVLARVRAVHPHPEHPEWPRQLAELGFTPGEPVQVLRRAWPGGDPLVVRIGSATFALRRAELSCIEVEPAGPTAPVPTRTAP